MSIGWFDNRPSFLGCEPGGGIGLNFSVLTHVTTNGCELNLNNTIECDGKLNATTTRLLTAAAHSAGTKVMLGVDFTTKACTTSGHISKCPILIPGAVQDGYVASLVAFVQTHGLDGVEVDYEAFGVGSTDDIKAKKLFTMLLVKIKQALTASSRRQQQHDISSRQQQHGDELGVCLASYDRNPFIFVEPQDAVDYYVRSFAND